MPRYPAASAAEASRSIAVRAAISANNVPRAWSSASTPARACSLDDLPPFNGYDAIIRGWKTAVSRVAGANYFPWPLRADSVTRARPHVRNDAGLSLRGRFYYFIGGTSCVAGNESHYVAFPSVVSFAASETRSFPSARWVFALRLSRCFQSEESPGVPPEF